MSFKYYVTLSSVTREVFPIAVNAKLKWQQENGKMFFRRKFSGSLIFTKATGDFDYFKAIELSGSSCDKFTLEIYASCNGTERLEWTGEFSTGTGKWDFDKCNFEVTPQVLDEYNCLADAMKKEYDLLQLSQMVYAVKKRTGSFQYFKSHVVVELFPSGDITTQDCWFDDGLGGGYAVVGCGTFVSAEWCLYKSYGFEYNDAGVRVTDYTYIYVRETMTTTCTLGACDLPDNSWKVLTANCPTDCTLFRCVPGDFDVSVFDRMRSVKEAINYMVEDSGCTSGFTSIFLDFDPDVTDPFYSLTAGGTKNYLTGKLSRTNNLMFSQMTDIKLPTSTSPATSAKIVFDSWINQICTMFNCAWAIKNGKFIIEHVNYFFSGVSAIDLSTTFLERQRGKSVYQHISDEIPKNETFSWMDKTWSSNDWDGVPIRYSSTCANGSDEEHACQNINVALREIFEFPEDYSDDGFCIVATEFDGTDYFLTAEQGVLSGRIIWNGHLCWANLHENYFKWWRYLKSGNLNEVDVSFYSWKPNVRQVQIDFPNCCEDIQIDPTLKYTTWLGLRWLGAAFGYIDSSELDLGRGTVKVIFKYSV